MTGDYDDDDDDNDDDDNDDNNNNNTNLRTSTASDNIIFQKPTLNPLNGWGFCSSLH